MLFKYGKFVLVSSAILLCLSSWGFGQADLARLIEIIDQDKIATLSEVKQLREKNSQNRQQAALFDFGYGLSAIKFGRLQEAIEVLLPFVEQRPQIYQARLLLMRAYIDLEQFDNVVLQAEKMLSNFPSQTESAKKVSKVTGTLVGFLNFARRDCADELKNRLEAAADKGIPEEFMSEYRESIALVESRVATINDEIEKASGKADSDSESSIAANLSEAEKLRKEAELQAEELQKREKLRAEKFEEMKLTLQKIENEYASLSTRHVFLGNQISNLSRQQELLEKEVKTEDKDGNKTIRTEITDRRMHSELGTQISRNRTEMSRLESSGKLLMNNYQQLRVQGAGLLNQQQLDELFSKNKMQQFGNAAGAKEKRAQRESDRKGKGSPATRGLSAKLKSYSTYEPLDVASNKEYLRSIAQRFLPK